MNIVDTIKKELGNEKVMCEIYEKALCRLPQGSLITKHRTASRCEYYHCLSSRDDMRYLSVKDRHLISQLQQKGLYEKALKACRNNIPVLERTARRLISFDDILLDSHPIGHLSNHNSFRKEELIFLAASGLYVRSKGEALITDILWQQGIHFYYEKKLILIDENGNIVILYPDFTIPVSRNEFIIWEHNGMLKNPEYRQRNNRKMELYFLNGYYQPKNLIITSDGPNGEFSVPDIQRVVDGLILPLL